MRVIGKSPHRTAIADLDEVWRGIVVTCDFCGTMLEIEGRADVINIVGGWGGFANPFTQGIISGHVVCPECNERVGVAKYLTETEVTDLRTHMAEQ